uniref:Uncharacterized protein n=1 Tax=Anguilla anguilla TaxID=7936 RepID=A0A0E9PW50_ANGAN
MRINLRAFEYCRFGTTRNVRVEQSRSENLQELLLHQTALVHTLPPVTARATAQA